MAGSYPDAPGRRIATDADGTVGLQAFASGASAATELTIAQMDALNSENETAGLYMGFNPQARYVTYLYPELHDLDGTFISVSSRSNTITTVDTSADTTSGLDGTWTNRIAAWSPTHPTGTIRQTKPNYREDWQSFTANASKGMRVQFPYVFTGYHEILVWHTYGIIAAGETPDRMLFLDTDAADAVFTKVLDYGDVPRGTTADRTIKVKNNSGSLSINTVQITAEDLTGDAGSFYEFSDDDITYSATLALGNIAFGVSVLVYIRQTLNDTESLGVQTGRFRVSHASVT